VLARTVVRDVFSQTEALRKLSLLAMITAIAPLLSPLLGSVILDLAGWRGTFAAILVWGILSLATVYFQLPETLPPERRGQLSLGKAFAAYLKLLGDPAAVGLLLAGGMSFAGMFAYITASPYYFIEMQGFSPRAYSLLFAANAFGIFAANYANSRLVRRVGAVGMIGAPASPASRVPHPAARRVPARPPAPRHRRPVPDGERHRPARRQLRRHADGTLSRQYRRRGGHSSCRGSSGSACSPAPRSAICTTAAACPWPASSPPPPPPRSWAFWCSGTPSGALILTTRHGHNNTNTPPPAAPSTYTEDIPCHRTPRPTHSPRRPASSTWVGSTRSCG
jgi:hypothetical protein